MNSLTPAQWLEVVRSQANRVETLEQRERRLGLEVFLEDPDTWQACHVSG
jgi:N12 class adenine-specific DNA methylase